MKDSKQAINLSHTSDVIFNLMDRYNNKDEDELYHSNALKSIIEDILTEMEDIIEDPNNDLSAVERYRFRGQRIRSAKKLATYID